MKSKIAFELYARENGVKVHAYQTNNGIFSARAWTNHCDLRYQAMTFAGVNVHHQNDVAERHINNEFS